MVVLFWKNDTGRRFNGEIAPKIRKLEEDFGDSALAHELRKIKTQINHSSASNTEEVLNALDERASQALAVYEGEYESIFKSIIEGLVDEGRIEEAGGFFDNDEKLSVALRIYSQVPIQKIEELLKENKKKERLGRKYAKLVREQPLAACDPIQRKLEWYLMEYEELIVEHEEVAERKILGVKFLKLEKVIKWVSSLFIIQKKLEKRARDLDINNKKLFDLLIFTQRFLSDEFLRKLAGNVRKKLPEHYLVEVTTIPAPDTTKSELIIQRIEEFLPNLFLSNDMTNEEKKFCQRMRSSLAECIYDRIKVYLI